MRGLMLIVGIFGLLVWDITRNDAYWFDQIAPTVNHAVHSIGL